MKIIFTLIYADNFTELSFFKDVVYLFLNDDLPNKDNYLSCDRFFIKSFLVSNNGRGLCYITQQNGKPSWFFLFYYKEHNNKKQTPA